MSLSKRLFLLMCFCIFPYIVYGQRVGLVLSGGGAKGIAHIGLIKALEENNIPIDYVAGTSMGAIVAAFYAMVPQLYQCDGNPPGRYQGQ